MTYRFETDPGFYWGTQICDLPEEAEAVLRKRVAAYMSCTANDMDPSIRKKAAARMAKRDFRVVAVTDAPDTSMVRWYRF